MTAYEYLLSYHIKPSVQRIAIMDYLLNHKTHPCIDEIYTALCKEIPTLSKTTVYNTLKLFVEHGAAKMLTIDEKMPALTEMCIRMRIFNARSAIKSTMWKFHKTSVKQNPSVKKVLS